MKKGKRTRKAERAPFAILREQGKLLTREQVKAIRSLMPHFGGGRAVASRLGVHWSTLYRYLSREIRVGVGVKIALCHLFEQAGEPVPFTLDATEQAIRQHYQST